MNAAIASEPVPVSQAAARSSDAQPTLRPIMEQQTRLRGEVAAKKGAFKDFTETERSALIQIQTRILSMLEGRDAIEQLRAEEKVELFNHLEQVSATVRQAEDDRQICERSRPVGSNRFQVVCMTAKQYREHKERAQQSLRTALKCGGADIEGCKNEPGGAIGGGQFKLGAFKFGAPL
jgi:hypothetical protein